MWDIWVETSSRGFSCTLGHFLPAGGRPHPRHFTPTSTHPRLPDAWEEAGDLSVATTRGDLEAKRLVCLFLSTAFQEGI